MNHFRNRKYRLFGFFLLMLICSPTYGRGVKLRCSSGASSCARNASHSARAIPSNSVDELPFGSTGGRTIETESFGRIPEEYGGIQRLERDLGKSLVQGTSEEFGSAKYNFEVKDAFNTGKKILISEDALRNEDFFTRKRVTILAIWDDDITELAKLYGISNSDAKLLANRLKYKKSTGEISLIKPSAIESYPTRTNEFQVLIFNNGKYIEDLGVLEKADTQGMDFLTCNSIDLTGYNSKIQSTDYLYLEKVLKALEGKNNSRLSEYEFISDLSRDYDELVKKERSVKYLVAFGFVGGGTGITVLLAEDED